MKQTVRENTVVPRGQEFPKQTFHFIQIFARSSVHRQTYRFTYMLYLHLHKQLSVDDRKGVISFYGKHAMPDSPRRSVRLESVIYVTKVS